MNISFLAAGLSDSVRQMRTALIALVSIFIVLTVGCIVFSYIKGYIRMDRNQRRKFNTIQSMLRVTTYIVAICTAICFIRYLSIDKSEMQSATNTTGQTEITQSTSRPIETENTQPIQDTTPVPDPTFTPAQADSSNPENWRVRWEIIKNGNIVSNYQRNDNISFGKAEEYFALPGIATFRGNNYRNSPVYGTATVIEKKLEFIWERTNGTLNGWPGTGWTGQPLMVQWDDETRAIMDMYPEKKTKEGLVEVIYATLDGYVYFFDLDDGQSTRKPVYLGMNFKGSGSLDPRGYPLLYVGSGDYFNGKEPRMYIVSLIDGTILYERKGGDNDASRSWCAFDSCPLIDAETDTLIWPCENGILYTIRLNTNYDKSSGSIKISPEDIVKARYSTNRSNSNTYWVGYEASAVIVDRYLYISENGGMFFCVDLDTMALVWAQDTVDDSNSTPVFEWNGQDGGYIYTAPSLHWTKDGDSGTISVYKLDARTGQIIWTHAFDCKTIDGVSGGVQATPLLGKPGTELEGLIIYAVARCPGYWDGKLVALSTETGETVWEKKMNFYTWSSPLPVYGEDGTAHIIIGDSNGQLFLLDSQGQTQSVIELGSNIEASPAMFNDTLVVGTRGNLICGIKVK